MENRRRALDDAFSRAIAPWAKGDTPVALLFSGGVDSGLLAWELRDRAGLVLSTVGTRDSPDLRVAEESAVLLGDRWVPAEIEAAEVREAAERIRRDTDDLSRTARSVLVAFSIALAHAPPGPILCGQGADELFLGYAHFAGLDAPSAEARSDSDLRQLLERDWPRSQRVADRLGRSIAAPYLDPGFMAAALAVPVEHRLPRPVPKAFFREWAMRRGLPPTIANRPKRALQYGSGIDRLLLH